MNTPSKPLAHPSAELAAVRAGLAELAAASTSMSWRLRQLQAQLTEIEQQADAPAPEVLGPIPPDRDPDPPRLSPSERAPAPPAQIQGLGFELRLGQLGLLIGGLFILIVGVAYFLEYSADRNWLGDRGRVALAHAAGVMMILAGQRFRRRSLAAFGLPLVGGGVAVLYCAGFAAFAMYDLVPRAGAFAMLSGVTVLAGAMAVRADSRWLAIVAVVGGFVTPVVLRGGGDHDVAFLSYLLILDAGVIGIASFKQWRVLEYLAFGFTWLLFAGWMADHYTPTRFWTALVFLHLYFAVFALVPFAHRLRTAGRTMIHFGLAAPNSLIAFAFAAQIVPPHGATWHLALITLAQACVFGALARYVYRHDRGADTFVLLLTLVIFYLVATVPLLMPANTITSFWAVQAAVFAWGARLLKRRSLRLIALILGGAVAVWWVVVDVIGGATSVWPASHAERWITAAVVLASSSALLRTMCADAVGVGRRAAIVAGTSVILSLGFVFANVELLFLMRAHPAQLGAVSVLWTLVATAMMVAGFRMRESLLRHAALWLFAATACKLFLLDVRGADRPARILAFLALGTILIGSSFLYHRYRGRIGTEA